MLVLDFINVGNGDSILVREMEGNGCVFPCWWTAATTAWSRDDHPPVEDPRSCRIFAGDFLRSQGVAHLDILLVTHFHRDHIGGLGRVLETVTVGELLTPMRPPADSGPLDPDGDNGLPKAQRGTCCGVWTCTPAPAAVRRPDRPDQGAAGGPDGVSPADGRPHHGHPVRRARPVPPAESGVRRRLPGERNGYDLIHWGKSMNVSSLRQRLYYHGKEIVLGATPTPTCGRRRPPPPATS